VSKPANFARTHLRLEPYPAQPERVWCGRKDVGHRTSRAKLADCKDCLRAHRLENGSDRHADVCHRRSVAQGGVMPPPGVVTCWEGVCGSCGETAPCCARSDYSWPDGRKAWFD
jgi:hypothetical protein